MSSKQLALNVGMKPMRHAGYVLLDHIAAEIEYVENDAVGTDEYLAELKQAYEYLQTVIEKAAF